MMEKPQLEKAHTIANATSGITLFSPNYSPQVSYFSFPQSGTISLYYAPGTPAPTAVNILSASGSTPVNPGPGQYTVQAGDYVQIVGPAASCKIQFYYQ
jgi:hypothetical protein